ncbi:MAG: fumarylacetoacetate hydrolase family protein [Pelagimonas sp.]|jgi:fumarylpyruvate hydrolase|nr:fumarylacetoacetate hydrolase family protein [Pelagimonas sp.]
MEYSITPPATPSLAVMGSDARFPVRRIYCVGRNYAAHAREMGQDPDREPPFFFSKPGNAVIGAGQDVPYPPLTQNLHHEAELVVAIGTGGADISEADAENHIWGYAIGNDLTRRDLQSAAKEKGRPWDMAKGFDHSAVIGPLHPAAQIGHPNTGAITLQVNGATKQSGDLSDMIWSIPEVIAHLSRAVTLAPGDLIMTGTPAGVSALKPGDLCTIAIDGLGSIKTRITERSAR